LYMITRTRTTKMILGLGASPEEKLAQRLWYKL
jgi:hypothetical protein